jgi:hypothetical protein
MSLALMLCGCQVLPQKDVLCSQSDRCEPAVSTPFVLGQGDVRGNQWTAGMQHPIGVVLTPNNQVLVADNGNGRILVWNTFPTENEQPADFSLGQPALDSAPSIFNTFGTDGNNSGTVVPTPTHLSSDGTHIVAASYDPDGGFDLLLFWSTFPMANNAAWSNYMFGDMALSAMPNTFQNPSPLLYGNQLYVADSGYNRVLIFDPAPGGMANANYALGQTSLTGGNANAGGLNNAALNAPSGSPASDGTRLFVPDTSNHRVLIWNALPDQNGVGANLVLGQADLMSGQANRGQPAALTTLSSPTGVAVGGGHVAVVDNGNNRVLLWNQIPMNPGQAADVVLGQSSGTSTAANAGGVSGSTLSGPQEVATDGTRLLVSDSSNNRVLIWNTWPAMNGAPADLILGQPAASTNAGDGLAATPSHFFAPTSVLSAGMRFVVVDSGANRVLLYPELPTAPSAVPDLVLGQPNFSSFGANNGGISANGLAQPNCAASDGTILAVADTGNHRVLVWNNVPMENQQPADFVLGQPNLSSNGSNAGTPTAGLNGPLGVFAGNNRLLVADTGNHRVLIWNLPITQNQEVPSIVLGQADFMSNSPEGGAMAAANNLKSPSAVFADDSHIYVSDSGNNRILIWNTLSPANGQTADVVVGQPDFMTTTAPSSTSNLKLGNPQGLQSYGSRLYAVDTSSNRVIYWDPIPLGLNQPAVGVLGQPDLDSGAVNNGGIGASTLNSPSSVLVTSEGIYIADTNNGRVVALPPQ